MNGGEVYKHAVQNLSSTVDILLNKYNISKNQIDFLIPHQANIRIIQSMGKKVDLDISKVIITVNQHANTSAASIPLAFNYAIKNNIIKPGNLILTEAMGGGFTWGGALIKI
jgi:3-oxoacyl-[acyl-carrier-protein] synthase-3